MCASEKSQWCGEPCFAGAAISISGILPQIPRRGKHKSLRITDLISALWKVNLMLALNRSLLKREYILMNVLKALASIISVSDVAVRTSIYSCGWGWRMREGWGQWVGQDESYY
jgi:hypothetical protein